MLADKVIVLYRCFSDGCDGSTVKRFFPSAPLPAEQVGEFIPQIIFCLFCEEVAMEPAFVKCEPVSNVKKAIKRALITWVCTKCGVTWDRYDLLQAGEGIIDVIGREAGVIRCKEPACGSYDVDYLNYLGMERV